jgi:hypothetical protein
LFVANPGKWHCQSKVRDNTSHVSSERSLQPSILNRANPNRVYFSQHSALIPFHIELISEGEKNPEKKSCKKPFHPHIHDAHVCVSYATRYTHVAVYGTHSLFLKVGLAQVTRSFQFVGLMKSIIMINKVNRSSLPSSNSDSCNSTVKWTTLSGSDPFNASVDAENGYACVHE